MYKVSYRNLIIRFLQVALLYVLRWCELAHGLFKEEWVAVKENLISINDHNLNSLLKQWGKRQTKKNRSLLTSKIKEFREISLHASNNALSFNKYIKSNRVKSLLDTIKSRNKKSLLQAKIKKKAFDIYVQRVKDAIPGNAFSDWLQAEKEVKRALKRNR